MILPRRFRALGIALGMLGLAGATEAASLRLCTWDAYTAPELLAKFAEETGVEVTIQPFDDYSALERMLADGHSGCDIAVPADYQMAQLIGRKLIEPIDVYRMPGFANIDEVWRSRSFDPRNEYSIPFHWGTASFVVDTAVVTGEVDSYKTLFEPGPELAGRVSLLYGASSVIQMALTYLGLPACSSDTASLDRVRRLIRERLPGFRVATIDKVIDMLAGGEVAIGIAWNGDALRARARKPSLRYAYPREGVVVWTDSLVMPVNAPNRAAATAFLTFMLRPENAALQSNFTHYANTIRGSDAHVDPALLEAPEVVVPSRVRLNFQGFCDAAVQSAHDHLLSRIVAEDGKPAP